MDDLFQISATVLYEDTCIAICPSTMTSTGEAALQSGVSLRIKLAAPYFPQHISEIWLDERSCDDAHFLISHFPHLITPHLSILAPAPSPPTPSRSLFPKHFQNRKVSSPAPVTTVCPSGLIAKYSTR